MKKNEGYTVMEIVISCAIFLMMTLSYVEASILLRDACYGSMVAQELQRDANIIMGYIVKNGPGEDPYPCKGLRSADSYTYLNPPSGISFTNVFYGTRKYYYDKGDNSIKYYSPTVSPHERTLYKAPPGTTISLLFSPIAPFAPRTPTADIETVGIYIALSRTVNGKTYRGSLSTYVNLGNVLK